MTRHRWSFFTAFTGLVFAAFVFWAFNAFGHGVPSRGPTARRAVLRGSSLVAPDSVGLVISMGDSKSVGASGGTPVTNVLSATDFVLCQDAATNEYEALHEANGSNCWADAETRGSGMVQVLRDRWNPPAAMMHVRCGQAGAQLDSNFYNADGGGAQALFDPQCLARIDEAIAIIEADPTTFGSTAEAVTAGRAVTILGVGLWIGANSDADAEADFEADLTGLVDLFTTEARSRTGQGFNPPWVVNTPYTWAGAGGETTVTGPVLGAIDVALAHADVYLGSPDYPMLGADTLHEAASGARWGAELAGHILYGALFGGAVEAPLMTAAHQDGTSAWFVFNQTVEIAEGTSSPTLGTGTGGASTTYGCAAHPGGADGLELNGGTPPTLSSCSASGAVVTCSIDAPMTVATTARYAWTGTPATAAFGCQGSSANPHGNIRSPTSLLYAQASQASVNLDGGGSVPDGGVDAGPSDSGTPDAGFPDGGVVPFIVKLDESFDHDLSTSNANSHAPLRCDGGPCVYCYDRALGAAGECQDTPDGGGGSHYVATAQQYQRARLAGGEATAVAMVADSYPGTAITSWDLSNVTSWDNAVAADVINDHGGACVWPTALIVGAGCYQLETTDTAFSSCSGAIATHLSTVLTSVGALTELCPDWTTADMEVLFTGGSFQAWGGSDDSWNQHLYSGSYIAYQDSAHWFCGHLGQISVGADGLHPDGTGLDQIADILASCLYRHEQGTLTSPMEFTAATWQSSTVLRLTFDLACRDDSSCADDPPISVDTTNLAAQTTQGDVVTYGTHFYMGGTLQTPGAAVTSATCGAASACTGNSCYCDLTFASDPGLTHDEVTIADTAEGPIGGSAHAGGGSSNLRADTTVAYALTTPVGDWAAGARVSANSPDAGVAPDAGPDGGTPDGGVHPEVEGRNWTISWTNANCTDTGSGDGVDDSQGVMHLDEDGTFNDLECDFDAATLGWTAGGLYNHTTAFGLGTNGVTGGCLENASSFPGVADEEPFVSRVVFLETSAQSTNRYHNWYQINSSNLFQLFHNAARVNTGVVRVAGTSITEAFTGGATLNVAHVLDFAHDPNGLWGPADTVYVCRDGVCESTAGADHGAIAGGSPFGFGGPFNCSAGIENMYYTHAGMYLGSTAAAEWSPSQHVVGALRWQTGGWASTYSLDPTSGNLSTAVTSGALDVLDEFTVLIWANASTLYLPAMSRWGGGGASTEQWWVGLIEANGNNGAVHYEIGLEQGGQGRVCNGTASGWQQIGFVYDGSTTSLDCYEDGALSNNALNGSVPASLNDEDQDLQIGTASGDDVDSFSYFNCALSAAEVLRVYCATHGAGAGACATAGPGSTSVDETDFDTYVLDHACFVEHCDFEQSGRCFNGTTLTGGSAAYTTAQP